MKKYNTIPKGYLVTVTTWENDGDNYNTVTKKGIIDMPQLIIELQMLKLLRLDNREYSFANQYEVSDEMVKEIGAAFRKIITEGNWQNTFETIWERKVDEINDEEMFQIISDTFYDYGAHGSGDSFAIRVVETIRVEWLQEDIQLEDVTEDFI